MSTNDPDQLRYSAIDVELKDMPSDFDYMIYSFSDNVSIQKQMTPISSGIPEIHGLSTGGTAIRSALSTVISDYKNGVWDGGDSPRVILLTDGCATDIGLFNLIGSILKEFKSEKISISTVGLGIVDKKLMDKIAKTTCGVFIDVSEAAELSDALSHAAVSHAERDLLSDRHLAKLDWLYGLLRVLFLFIIGTCIGLACGVLYGVPDSFSIIAISSAIKSLVGAISMEVGICTIGIPVKIMWLIL